MARPDGQTQVNFWIEGERKEQWKEAVADGPEYQSLTQLIRVAVEKELRGEGTSEAATAPVEGVETMNERIGEVHDAIIALDRRIDGLDDDLGDVMTSLELSKEDSLDELAQLVYEQLPKSKGKAESLAALPPENGRDDDEPTGNPHELSERLNVPVSRIHDALDRLDEDMPGMIDATAGGTEPNYGHYYAG